MRNVIYNYYCVLLDGLLSLVKEAEGQRNGKFRLNGQNGKLGHSCVRVTKDRL